VNVDIGPVLIAPGTGHAQLHFRRTVSMWEAVRANQWYGARVANNSTDLAELPAWPINVSWALVANPSS
jgi:hypothetical protein